MGARCSLVVNGRTVRVSTGDTPIEAALADGMIASNPDAALPFGRGAASSPRRVPARRARAEAAPRLAPLPADRTIAGHAEPAPVEQVLRKGSVSAVRCLSPGIVEVVATLTRRPVFEPGQQLVVTFEGLPPMTLSPTLRVDGSAEINEVVFHLARDPEGDAAAESPRLDQAVRLKGPVGRAQYRPGGGRLVLAAAGPGFAPIWAISRAARYIEPERELTLAVGARDPLDLYMRESLDWLRRTGVARLILCADRAVQRPADVRPGPLTAHLPTLRATDVVHVAGDQTTVGAVRALAASVGARCHPLVV